MKHIKTKIIMLTMTIIIVICTVFGVLSVYLAQTSAFGALETSLSEMAKVAAQRVENELNGYLNVALAAGMHPELASEEMSVFYKQSVINRWKIDYGFENANLTDTAGKSVFGSEDFSQMDFFQKAMKGEACVSDPIVGEDGKAYVYIAAPLWHYGIKGGTPMGVVIFMPESSFLSDIVTSINMGKTGSAYMLRSDGLVIAHKDESLVMTDNSIEGAKTDSRLHDIAAMESAAVSGGNGAGTYVWGGVKKIMAYAPVPGSNGWAIAVTAEQSEFLAGARLGVIATLVAVALFLVIGIFVAVRFGTAIAAPIRVCTDRIRLLATGDLKPWQAKINTKDETKELADATIIIVEGLRNIVQDLVHLLKEMGGGNFDVHTTARENYIGDFEPLYYSIEDICDRLSSTMLQIDQASNQVSAGAEQVSSGAQALSQGATEQSSGVEEITATIMDVAEKIKGTAGSAAKAREENQLVYGKLEQCSNEMREMVTAISDISAKSSEIGKIIKTIEDIAFQTNILALNAAVEAARAGTAGKGFAVVADEVRNLASKSAEAAKNTTALIESTLHSVKRGTALAGNTEKSLGEVVENAKNVFSAVENISGATNEQAQAIAQVSSGMDQVSSVVQTNSASAEESAAASEELSGQAAMLKELVSRFSMRQVGADALAVSQTTPGFLPLASIVSQSASSHDRNEKY